MIKLGIDYGTTTTLVSYTTGNTPTSMLINIGDEKALGYKRSSIPSVIALENGNISYGYAAEALADHGGNGTVVLRSLKRCISCERKENQKALNCANKANFSYCVGGKKYLIHKQIYKIDDLLRTFLDNIISKSTTRINKDFFREIGSIGISVPAIFGSQPRHTIFENVLKLVEDNKQIEIINEPTAALVACQSGMLEEEDGVYAICDVGGGTTDIVIFEVNRIRKTPYFFFRPTGCQVAGDDVDYTIVRHFYPDSEVTDKRLTEARRAKELLTVSNSVNIYGTVLTREKFNEIIRPTIQEIVDALGREVKKVFDFHKPYSETKSKFKLNAVFLSGGGSKIPCLSELIRNDPYLSSYDARVGYIRQKELSRIYGEDLPIVVVALGTSLQNTNLSDSVQYMLPYEIRSLIGGIQKTEAKIFSELPVEFSIKRPIDQKLDLVAVDPNIPDNILIRLSDELISSNDEMPFWKFSNKHRSLQFKIDKFNIMRVTARGEHKPFNRPFDLPWQGGIEKAMFEKYRKQWRKENLHV